MVIRKEGKMVFIEDNVTRCSDAMGMKVIYEISFGVWFETNEDAWVGTRVKLLSVGFEGTHVTQATKDSKIRDITRMRI